MACFKFASICDAFGSVGEARLKGAGLTFGFDIKEERIVPYSGRWRDDRKAEVDEMRKAAIKML